MLFSGVRVHKYNKAMSQKPKFIIFSIIGLFIIGAISLALAQTGEGSLQITTKITCNSQTFAKVQIQIKCLSGSKIDCKKENILKFSNVSANVTLQDGTPYPSVSSQSSSGGQIMYEDIWKKIVFANDNDSRYFSFLTPLCGKRSAELTYYDLLQQKNITVPIKISSQASLVCWQCPSGEEYDTVIGNGLAAGGANTATTSVPENPSLNEGVKIPYLYCPSGLEQYCRPSIELFVSKEECEANMAQFIPAPMSGSKCFSLENAQACNEACQNFSRPLIPTSTPQNNACAKEGEKVGQCQNRQCCEGLVPRPPLGPVCQACDICEAFTCVKPNTPPAIGNVKWWYCQNDGNGQCQLSAENFSEPQACLDKYASQICFPNLSGLESQMQTTCNNSCNTLINGSLSVHPFISSDASCNKIIKFQITCLPGKKISCSGIDLQYEYSPAAESYVSSKPSAERFDFGYSTGGIIHSWLWRGIEIKATSSDYIITMRPGSFTGTYAATIYHINPTTKERLTTRINMPWVEKCATGDGGITVVNPDDGKNNPSCGNASCELALGENNSSCPQDCQQCNLDKTCQAARGETVDNCADCANGQTLEFSVASKPASDISEQSMVLNGELMGLGENKNVLYGFQYYPCAFPEMLSQTKWQAATSPVAFSFDLLELPPDTEICFKALAQASSTVLQGDLLKAKTLSNKLGLVCPMPLSPKIDENITSLSTQLSWSMVNGGKYYQYALYETALGGALIKEGDTNGNTVNVGPLVWGKHYYWRVNACTDSTLKNCSNWCPAWHFITGVILNPPVITSPSSTSISEKKPLFSWDYTSGAQYYEYVLLSGSTEIIRDTISSNRAYPPNELPLGDYILNVRACRDQQKQNCSEYAERAFSLKDEATILANCSALRIGSKKFASGDPNYIYLEKCSAASCPSPYKEPNIDLKASYVVNPEYKIYLLDENRGIKYESGSSEPLPQGQTLRLVIEPLVLPSTNFGNGGYNNTGGQKIAYSDNAQADFENNEKLIISQAYDDNGVPFQLGAVADNPVNLPDFHVSLSSHFELVKKSGGIYVKAASPTFSELSPEAEVNITVPQLSSYQTADNIYLNQGCIAASAPQKLLFNIKALQQLKVSAKYEGRGYVKIDADPAKSNLEYKMKCFSTSQGKQVELSVSQQSEASRFLVSVATGITLDSSVRCEYSVTDPDINVDFFGSIEFEVKDIMPEKPATPIFKSTSVDYCQYPAKITFNWESPSPQKGYNLVVYQQENLLTDHKEGTAVPMAVKNIPGDGVENKLRFTGSLARYFAVVSVQGDNGLWSEPSEPFEFSIEPRPAAQPMIEVERVNTVRKYIEFKGFGKELIDETGKRVEVTIPPSPLWEWYSEANQVVPEKGINEGSPYYRVPFERAQDIYLKLRFHDEDLNVSCDYVTTTKFNINVEFKNTGTTF